MNLSTLMIKNIVAVAQEIFSQQSLADLHSLQIHYGTAYREVDAVATIVAEMALRLYGTVDFSTRALSPLSLMAEEAASVYRDRYQT